MAINSEVLCGLDVAERGGCASLTGRKVGLITNHTGLNLAGRSTIDILHSIPGIQLTTLFSPEHGIRGALDEKVSDGKDEKTGLPVYSLYGERTRPTPQQLANLDCLIYDIQDIGTRFYTFISTLGLCLRSAAENGLRFVIFDRPNPLGGIHMEGPIADADSLDFTAYHTLPIRHGLTVGELARLFNKEKNHNADLHVIKCEKWKREQTFEKTNLTWTNPSPNMRSLTQAFLYPGIGLLEFTNLSVGRGTDTPFEVVGAPWINGRELAKKLNAHGLKGVRFIPIRFTPKSSIHSGLLCNGINIHILNRDEIHPVLMGLTIAETLLKLYKKDWTVEKYARLFVNRTAYNSLLSGESAAAISNSWRDELETFSRRRQSILLYD